MPLFVLPAKRIGGRLQEITRESYGLNASMNATMTERFNVAGALLVKLFGRPEAEAESFRARAARVRDIGVLSAMYGRTFFTALTLVAALATALVYGLGGSLAFDGSLTPGAVVSLALLLSRLYGPLTALSNVRVDVMSAMVSFDRVFEVLDLAPMIAEAPDARPVPAADRSVEFDHVSFSYPTAEQVSLASLEDLSLPEHGEPAEVLHDVCFRAEPGQLVALVGPSGAGKSTIANLVPRLYDVTAGAVRVGGVDVREATADSLRDAIGVVSQDAHLFHDTIRANLLYARPEATEDELWAALAGARIAALVASLPDGLDTVVGDRGYRMSGGEKQRLAIARVLLKAPGIVILDEATAHLDSESEVAVQQALDAALAGRTSLVIAHRLSTIRSADQILVVDGGRIVERGTHDELLAAAAATPSCTAPSSPAARVADRCPGLSTTVTGVPPAPALESRCPSCTPRTRRSAPSTPSTWPAGTRTAPPGRRPASPTTPTWSASTAPSTTAGCSSPPTSGGSSPTTPRRRTSARSARCGRWARTRRADGHRRHARRGRHPAPRPARGAHGRAGQGRAPLEDRGLRGHPGSRTAPADAVGVLAAELAG